MIKFERMQFYFLSDHFSAVVILITNFCGLLVKVKVKLAKLKEEGKEGIGVSENGNAVYVFATLFLLSL